MSSVRGLYVSAGRIDIANLIQIRLIYSVSCFNLGRLGTLFGGAKTTKVPCGDGTVGGPGWEALV